MILKEAVFQGFTGIDSPYEAPENPEVVVKTAEMTVTECMMDVVKVLVKKVCLFQISLIIYDLQICCARYLFQCKFEKKHNHHKFYCLCKNTKISKAVLYAVSFVTASEIAPSQSIKQNFSTNLEILDAIHSDALSLRS